MTNNLRRGGRAILVSLGLAGGSMAAAFVGVLLAASVFRLAGATLTPTLQFVLFVPGFVMFALVAAAYMWYRDLSVDYLGISVPSLRDVLWIGAGYVLSFGIIILIAWLLTTLNAAPDSENSAATFAMDNPEFILWMIPLNLLVVGPAEEYLYRGIIQNRLGETFIPPVAIVLTALIFAPMHFVALSGAGSDRLLAISILFFPAIIFGLVYEKTGNLVANSILHGLYNSTFFFLIYISIKFADVDPGTTAALF